jgi:hypothetical protein
MVLKDAAALQSEPCFNKAFSGHLSLRLHESTRIGT